MVDIETLAVRAAAGEQVEGEIAAQTKNRREFFDLLMAVNRRASEIRAILLPHHEPEFQCERIEEMRPVETRMVFGKKKTRCPRCDQWVNPNNLHTCGRRWGR